MLIKPVASDNLEDVVYLYDESTSTATAFAAVKRHADGSLSIQVTTEVEVYRDGLKLMDSVAHDTIAGF
jgi:hypothetical protein